MKAKSTATGGKSAKKKSIRERVTTTSAMNKSGYTRGGAGAKAKKK